MHRRQFIRVAVGGGVVLAGCSGPSDGASDDPDADVVAGPGGRLVFEPDSITAATGDTLTWHFDSAGHNVSGRPDDSDRVSLPTGAEPYSSYGADESPRQLVPAGGSYDHTFDVAGRYEYVCIPHISAGMVGTVVVED